MYIGPWQEYNLSKARSRAPNNAPNSGMKRGLEEAIAKSLDPAAAQAALAAVETFFSTQQSQPQGLPPLQPHCPQLPRQQQLSYRNARVRRHLPTLTHRHLVEAERGANNTRMIMSDSTDSLDSGMGAHAYSPMSVRSTQSDPIHSASHRLPALVNKTTPSLNTSPSIPSSSSRLQLTPVQDGMGPPSSYNTSAVLSLLRLERSQKARAALQKVTGWRTLPAVNDAAAGDLGPWIIAADKAKNSTNAQKRRLDPMERDKQRRLEQVESMRQTYLLGDNRDAQCIDKDKDSNKNRDKGGGQEKAIELLPPIHTAHPFTGLEDSSSASRPSTSCVKPLHLTDSELQLVSKYFVTQQHLSGATQSSSSSSSSGIVSSVDQRAQGDKSRVLGIGIGGLTEESNSALPSPARSITTNSGVLSPMPRTASTPGQGQGQHGLDELFVGGIDGLLKWSSQLDFNSMV
jgi:hypothetical protein